MHAYESFYCNICSQQGQHDKSASKFHYFYTAHFVEKGIEKKYSALLAAYFFLQQRLMRFSVRTAVKLLCVCTG